MNKPEYAIAKLTKSYREPTNPWDYNVFDADLGSNIAAVLYWTEHCENRIKMLEDEVEQHQRIVKSTIEQLNQMMDDAGHVRLKDNLRPRAIVHLSQADLESLPTISAAADETNDEKIKAILTGKAEATSATTDSGYTSSLSNDIMMMG